MTREDFEKRLYAEGEEKPLQHIVEGYSFTSILRSIAFIGDSMSSGEFETVKDDGSHGYYDYYDFSWGQYIARKNGLTAYNFSCGGLMTETYLSWFIKDHDTLNKDKICHAYVIALGANDCFNCGRPVGSLDDIDKDDYNNNKATFIGNYDKIVRLHKEQSPKAKFFFVTVPDGPYLGHPDVKKDISEKLTQLAEATENAYVIDLYKYGPVYDEKFMEKYFRYGHMTPTGYVVTAQLIDSYIDYIIRTNPDDFKRVGFITKDVPEENF